MGQSVGAGCEDPRGKDLVQPAQREALDTRGEQGAFTAGDHGAGELLQDAPGPAGAPVPCPLPHLLPPRQCGHDRLYGSGGIQSPVPSGLWILFLIF